MTDLVIRGGTVVTAQGSRQADIAIRGGTIEAVEPDLSGAAAAADEVVDATGLLVLPGVVDVHTHSRVASDAEPDRFFQDSVAAAFGGTTTFLVFNTPASGEAPGAPRSLVRDLADWRRRTEADSAVDYALSPAILGGMDDPLAELPAMVDAGVPTAKAFMVYDFRLPDERLFAALRAMGRGGGMLEVHCENATVIDALVADAVARGNVACRHHALTRPTYAEAEATHRAIALARAAGASVYVVHLSCADALAEVAAAKARGWPVYAETCPHYLTLTEERYEAADEQEVIRSVISPPLRSESDRGALWLGLRAGGLDLIATDHVPDRLAVEKRCPAPPFPQISNGAPGIETLLSVVHDEGVAGGRISVERMVDLLATTPARLFGMTNKGAIEVGRDADLVLFDPQARRTIRQAGLHHTGDFTPYEDREVRGAVRSVFQRGNTIIRDGAFVGGRGAGQFLERAIAADDQRSSIG